MHEDEDDDSDGGTDHDDDVKGTDASCTKYHSSSFPRWN